MPGPLDNEQWGNAVTIYKVGQRMGMSPRDIQIALITAMQESGLRNLHYGDRDSQGLFQQRPSQGWGTVEQVTNPVYAATKFYNALKGVNRNQMGMGQAAQAVQRSAYPDAYSTHIPLVKSFFSELSKAVTGKSIKMTAGPEGSVKAPHVETLPFTGTPTNVMTPLPLAPPTNGLSLDATPMMDTMGAANQAIAAPDMRMLSANYGAPVQQQIPGVPSLPMDTGIAHTILNQQNAQALASAGGLGMGKGINGTRAHIVSLARDMLGTPYVWGASSRNAVDCSGLVQLVYGEAGHSLPRVSYQQANSGKRVGIGALQPGDLVAWDNSSRNAGADHIAIYIGGGRIIEAAHPGTNVRVRTLGHDEGAWGVHMNI